MAAQPQPSAGGLSPPPDLPNLPKTEDGLVNWLRTFSLWCRQGFAAKLDASGALPGVMVQSTDQAVANPPVWMFGVDSGGTATLAPVTLGSGAPGDPTPVGAGQYLSLDGGVISGDLTINAHLGVENGISTNGWNTFYQVPGQITQAGGGPFMIQATSGYQPFITFHCPGYFACNFGMDASGHFYCGGWSFGTGVAYQFWTSRDFAHPLAAIEELQTKVATLEARLATLEVRR